MSLNTDPVTVNEQRLAMLRMQLFTAAQTLKGVELEELRTLLGEVQSILPDKEG